MLLVVLEAAAVSEVCRDHNREKKMGGSEQPVRCTRKTHSKLGRSGTGCGLSPGSMLLRQRSTRAHLQRVSLPGKVTFKCRSSDFGEGCPWFQPTFPAPRSPGDDLKGLVQLKWFYESIIFLRLCFMGWIRAHHWMKIRCPFMNTWFWKDLEEHQLNFPRGRNFLLRITAAYTPQFVQAVTQPLYSHWGRLKDWGETQWSHSLRKILITYSFSLCEWKKKLNEK